MNTEMMIPMTRENMLSLSIIEIVRRIDVSIISLWPFIAIIVILLTVKITV